MNDIKLLQFLTTEDDKYSRRVASKVVRDYTKNNLPKAISVKGLDILGRKPMNYYDFKQMRGSDKCIWEHAIPVNELVSAMFTNSTLIEYILSNAPICIVTAEEDHCLTENGFRDTRDNWRNAYHECNIKLVEIDKEDELAFYKSFYEMNYKPYYETPLNDIISELVTYTGNKSDYVFKEDLYADIKEALDADGQKPVSWKSVKETIERQTLLEFNFNDKPKHPLHNKQMPVMRGLKYKVDKYNQNEIEDSPF